MTQIDEHIRVAARCYECGEIYAAEISPKDSLRIIGRNDCQCGGTEFQPLTKELFQR
jgi:hypothetical protein